jgi:hypothetical protein
MHGRILDADGESTVAPNLDWPLHPERPDVPICNLARRRATGLYGLWGTHNPPAVGSSPTRPTWTGRGALVTESAGQIRAGLARWYGPSLVWLEDLGRGTVRGTGRLIIPVRRVPSVRFAVLSVQPVRPQRGTVSLVMRRSGVRFPKAAQLNGAKFDKGAARLE